MTTTVLSGRHMTPITPTIPCPDCNGYGQTYHHPDSPRGATPCESCTGSGTVDAPGAPTEAHTWTKIVGLGSPRCAEIKITCSCGHLAIGATWAHAISAHHSHIADADAGA